MTARRFPPPGRVVDPLLAQHLHSLIMFQRLAISNGYGWKRFVRMVDQVLPKRGTTLELPLLMPDGSIGYAARLGLDPSAFSGHSLRSGFLTSAAARGASLFKMMDVSRHKTTVSMLLLTGLHP